jgi:hypothetical protein
MGGCQRKQLEDFGFRIADLELRDLTYEMWDMGRHGVSGETSETGKDDRRQRTGDRSQKKGITLWERLSAAIRTTSMIQASTLD